MTLNDKLHKYSVQITVGVAAVTGLAITAVCYLSGEIESGFNEVCSHGFGLIGVLSSAIITYSLTNKDSSKDNNYRKVSSLENEINE